jgi:predicted MPP superfamily phosphohydrolase
MVGKVITRVNFFKIGCAVFTISALIILGRTIYSSIIEPAWIETVSINLTLHRLHPNFDGYKIAQISDIHIGTWMTRERLMDVVEKVNLQSPDLVVITGDFVHRSPENFVDDLTIPLSKLTPKDGVFAVLGNHDHWTNPDLVRNILKTADIIELRNQVHVFESGSATMSLSGVDGFWEGLDQMDLVLDALPEEGAVILLAHEPDYADISAETGRFDLQLSGHTHGGQVVLPFSGPIILPAYGHKYPSGLYLTNGMYHYTNRGIGMINPVVRFNCRPEVTIFTLRSPGQK